MRIIFMGTPDFAVSTLDAIVNAGHEVVLCVTQPDKEVGRGKQVRFTDVKAYAIEHDIPVFQPRRIREPEAIEELSKYPADIFVVAAFGQILPKEVLEMPRFGCINVHASLLPKYRGAAPIQWSILNGEEVTGVTIMQMGVGLDDGDMLLQKEVKIESDETGGSLFDKLAKVGGALCVEAITKIEEGSLTPVPQDESQATHVGMIKKELGRIDFTEPAAKIERYIRGLYPWPGAFSTYQGKTVKFFAAEVVNESHGAAPGTVVRVDKDSLLLQTGEGCLSVKELQLEGKKRMEISDFLRGKAVQIGEIFGA